ncbi:MAG: N-acetylmuramoyl-L-alanine amidase [Bacteroidetes bacterium ADurb.BinA395]|nr:MAG: N-acetylmuramoyl-L-alanine amidase [Bacteroidetes bacterium ADurb.BinA395]
MKKIISFFFVLMLIFSAKAVDFTGIKIYINPGHGGYNGANDRNVQTIPFALGDTLGFWESASNLTKGLALRDLLQAANATVYMSRTQNREEDDRALSEIAEEANANNVDAFLSIHSNALGTNTGTNYLLLLYHGYDNQPTVAASLPMAQAAWPRLSSNQLTVWTNTSTNIRGDFSFYGNTSGLGVLRPLTVPGFLSEGSFHDYLPETHRLLNKDYRKLESNNFYRYFCDYFQANLPSTGIIAGFAKSSNEKMNNPLYIYKAFTHDEKVPINGAKVKLMNQNGDSLNVYYVDTLYNGIFAFYNLAPGTYKLHLEAKDYQPKDTTVTVTAASTTYAKMFLPNLNVVIPKDTTPDYPDPIQEAGVLPMKHYNFGDQEVVVPEWLNQQPIKKVLYRDEKLYVLTTEPKITIYNAQSLAKIREMDLSGIEGGVNLVSDIAFTSDGYLLACNKDTISLPENKGRYFKVYTWDNDSVAPSLLFKTQQQANWSNGIMGETFAVSGPRWKCTIYVPSVTTGSSKAIRIVGYLYEEGNALGYKYMLDAANYTEALWGKNIKFHISPTGKSHFILDSEKVLPVEYQFDWNAADRSPLIKKGEFSEQNGFNLAVCASGIHFFRHAQHTFMVSPTCDADTTKVGAVLFDVTNGIQQSLKVSEKLPANGLGTAKASYMVAAAKVSGYDLDVMVLAQNEGMARFRTVAGPAVANIYASELKVEKTETDFILKFTLNENATSVKIDILDGENIIKTIDAGALNKGVQSVPVPLTELPTGSFTWSVTASTEAVDRPVKISDDSRPELQFYSPRGVAVDNNFESPFFGRVYATETVGGNTTNRTTQDGVYILNAALEDVTQQGAHSYAGSVSWAGSSSPMRLAVAEDGKVYVTDWSDAHPGVWIMDPAAPSAPFVPVFSGLTKATSGLSSINGVNVHGSISHCWVLGKGEDTRLYTFDEDYVDAVATSAGNVLQYNIGTLATSWQQAPSAIVYNDALNGNLQQNYNSCIAPDGRGGWWISQYRSADAANIPSLIHVNMDGLVDFNSGKTPTLIENSYTGGMAVTVDGKTLAMGCNNEVKIFSVTFSEDGIPSLTRLYSIKPAMGTNTAGLAFDRAGNVYVISNSTERLGVWSLPKIENVFTTPAPASEKLDVISEVPQLEKEKTEILLYPNPATDHVVISSKTANLKTIAVYDTKGRLIRAMNAAGNQMNLSLEGMTPGLYIVQVQTDERLNSFRLIKL